MLGSITHIEVASKTGIGTAKFLSELFGWKFNSMGGDGGWFDTPTCKAGLHPNDPNPGITVYLLVADIEKAVAKVRELGGEAGAISPEEPGFGRFCPCRDPEGVSFGLHQAAVA